MIVRVYEESTEASWVGELEDLLEANHFLTGPDRKRLKALEPGESVEVDPDFRVERPEAAKVPVIPGLPSAPGLTRDQKILYGRAHKMLSDAEAHVGFILQRKRTPTPKEERDAAEALSSAANELRNLEWWLANAREGIEVPAEELEE